jgi:acyl-CoA hydrolase
MPLPSGGTGRTIDAAAGLGDRGVGAAAPAAAEPDTIAGMTLASQLRGKLISPEDAARRVNDGNWLDLAGALAQPDLFEEALASRTDLRNLNIRGCLSMLPRHTLEKDPEGQRFHWFNWHFSGYDRAKNIDGCINYIPMNFGEAPDYYRRFIDPIDVVCIKTRPMDDQGFFNFGGATTYVKAATEQARVLFVETCDALPYIRGEQESVHLSQVDGVIDGGVGIAPEIQNPEISEVDRKVAEFVIGEIDDGACLQIGIGGMPNAVCASLKSSGIKDLGVHTEMFVDEMVDLIELGIVTGARKTLNPYKVVFTFAAGSRRTYDFLHHNSHTQSFPVDYTNLPHNIMRNDAVVAINNTTQMDLQGQAASETAGHRHLTGTGGQLQFVRGAYASKGGKSFMCLSSVYERNGERSSRIVSTLTPGNVVTTPRTDMMYVVTEYGIANLKGRSVAERSAALIGLAHPDFREGLAREARDHKLLPRHFEI